MKYYSIVLSVITVIMFVFTHDAVCQNSVQITKKPIFKYEKELGLSDQQVERLLRAMRTNQPEIDQLLKDLQMNPQKRMLKLIELTRQRDSVVNSCLTPPQRERFSQILQNQIGKSRQRRRMLLDSLNKVGLNTYN